jgi:hypothetical protein
VTLANRLAEHAFASVVIDLEGFGSRLNNKHRTALYRIVQTYSSMACGETTGRYAFDLPTGCGRTQSVIAWCQAVHELQTGHSVVIAASKVEELCELKRKLVEKGVPGESVGLIHSKHYDPELAEEWRQTRDPRVLKPTIGRSQREYASLPKTTNNEKRPFLLVTHSRVQSRHTNIDLLNSFNDRPRDLVIWDESLLVAEGRGIGKREIDAALAWLCSYAASDPSKRDAIAYFSECVDLLNAELGAQKQLHCRPRLIRLPSRTEYELDRCSKALANRIETKPLGALLKFSQGDLRVVPISQGGGAFVRYDITVPPSLENIVVLDASYPIRELEQLDPSIKRPPHFDGAVKRYDQVVIHHMRHGCGRSAMERSFSEDTAEARGVSREICEVVSKIHPTEGIIFFTFKADEQRRSINMRDLLERDLKAVGVDVGEVLKDGPDAGKPRFRFLTWGQETAINDHKHCPNVVFVGVIHRSEADLSAAILGQQDDLLSDIPGTLISNVRRSENAHALYQAMSRGSCRDTVEGQGKAMRVWLMHYDAKVCDLVSKIMPGVVWEAWSPKFLDPFQSKVEELALQVLSYLRQLGPEISRLSTRALKRAVGVTDTPQRTFSRVVRCVAEADAGWFLRDRSLQRSPFWTGTTVTI